MCEFLTATKIQDHSLNTDSSGPETAGGGGGGGGGIGGMPSRCFRASTSTNAIVQYW